MSAITVAEIERDPAGWLRRVKAGEEFAIVEGGKTVAEVKPPAEGRRPRVAGTCAGQFTVPDDFDDPLPDEIIDEFYK